MRAVLEPVLSGSAPALVRTSADAGRWQRCEVSLRGKRGTAVLYVNRSLSDTVTYTELPSSSCQVCNTVGVTTCHLLASDIKAQRGPFEAVLDADREVDCTTSLAFATSTSLGKVDSTPLKQAGSMTCLTSWYGVFPDDSTWSAAEYTVSFAMSGLLGNSSPATGGNASLVGQTARLTPSFSLRLGDKVTVKELVEPQLVVSSITAAPVAGLTRVYGTRQPCS